MKKELSVLLTLFLLLFSIFLSGCTETPDYSLEVEGGLVITESDNRIIIRSYTPNTDIDIQGFKGELIVTNSHPDSNIEGTDTTPEIQGANITFKIEDQKKKDITIDAPDKSSFNFAIIGDTQGMNHIFQDAVDSMEDIEFLIHLGDITPSSKEEGFDKAQDVMDTANFPIYTTLGNHDVRFDGRDIYTSRFSPSQYSFSYSDLNFIFLDSSELTVEQEQIDRMESQLSDSKKNIIVTHAPYFDPFGDSHTIDETSQDLMEEFISKHDIDAFMAGHIHSYHLDTSSNTKRLITGGGGGSLVEGEHHYVLSDQDLNFEKVPIETEEQNVYEIFIEKGDKNETYTYQGLLYDSNVQGFSSFQNQFGNQRGQGYYEGVKISTLLEGVGGMDKNDTLAVESIDGYQQKFGYLNVYPNEEFQKDQGDLVLATRYDNQTTDEWEDGPRLVTIPEDGYYSNQDCLNTSYEGQGYHVYDSAGARWVKYVKHIRVIEDG